MNTFYKTAETLKQGAMTLPKEYYTDFAVLNKEMENIFTGSWLCCGRCDDVYKAGQYILINIGNESIIILRDDNNKLQAFYNVCRHRGTRICTKEEGKFSKTIQCPYHGWTYDLQGNLYRAPNMNAVEDYNKSDFPLHNVRLVEWEGFLFINLSDNPVDFHLEYSPLMNRFAEWKIEELKEVKTKTYLANCNWKLIIQNYSECYHCPLIHPNLADITSYTGGRNDLVAGPFLGGYMEMNTESITKDGNLCGPLIGNLSDKNLNRVYYYALFPNMLLSLHPDFVMIHTVWPEGSEKCRINCSWLFSKGIEGHSDYHPEHAIDFWDKTNLEDWEICNKSQLGIKSRKYKPGPYSGQESLLAAYDEYYLSILNKI